MTPDANQEPREAHAVVPHRERVLAAPGNGGIDHQERSPSQVHRDETLRHPDLGGGDGPPEPVAGPEVLKGRDEGIGLLPEPWVPDVTDPLRGMSKHRVADQADLRGAHGSGKRCGPSSARRSTGGLMFAPERISTNLPPLTSSRRSHAAANAAAPEGSTRTCPASMSVRTAASRPSSGTTMASSTNLHKPSSACRAGTRQARPSATVSIGSSIGRRAWKLSTIAEDPLAWTATTRASGWTAFTMAAVPTTRVPLPIGT